MALSLGETTELGYMASIKPEFDRRGVKIIAISVDPVDKHSLWAADIKETQGHAPNYPMIGDPISKCPSCMECLPPARRATRRRERRPTT